MTLLGAILAAAGLLLSLATFVHDVRRQRISSREGAQSAPGRIAPEVHALAGILIGVGVGLSRGWLIGLGAGLSYSLIVYLVIRPILDR